MRTMPVASNIFRNGWPARSHTFRIDSASKKVDFPTENAPITHTITRADGGAQRKAKRNACHGTKMGGSSSSNSNLGRGKG